MHASLPNTFQVGQTLINGSLVSVSQITSHLALLDAFAKLKSEIEGLTRATFAELLEDPEKRWGWFVGLAVDRFEIWCKALRPADAMKSMNQILPPLDVLMVWHTYMLNPKWYAVDCSRIPDLSSLRAVGALFSAALSGDLYSILVSGPTNNRVEDWEQKTSLPFDYLVSATRRTGKAIPCPKCSFPINHKFINTAGTGYLQTGFKATCSEFGCRFPSISRQHLAFRKFAHDLAESATTGMPFLGVSETDSKSDKDTGERFKNHLLVSARKKLVDLKVTVNGARSQQELLSLAIMEMVDYDFEKLRSVLPSFIVGYQLIVIRRILSAYTSDQIFSVELVGAVLRQGSFVTKMKNLHWTEPGFFGGSEARLVLYHAIARYHAFLDLMSSTPASFFVPTLDIDLAWHTHQLLVDNYGADCKKYIGRFIDHDDKIEGPKLSSAFELTCRAWKHRFKVNYTHCGCPIPGDTIGQKLSRIIKTTSVDAESPLVPLSRPDLLGATHPSDHNGVYFQPRTKTAHSIARNRYEKRVQQAAKSNQKARDKNDRVLPHDVAFLIPVPLYFTPPVVGAGCVSASGTFVGSSGGCGTRNGSCAGSGGCGSGGDGGGGGDGCGGGCGGCGG